MPDRKHIWLLSGIAILLLWGGITQAEAAEDLYGHIHGTVTDATSGNPLTQANLVLQGTSRGATTDSAGSFVIPDIKPGQYRLTVTYIGYAIQDTAMQIRPDATFHLHLTLQPKSLSGDQVVITAGSTPIEHAAQTSRIQLTRRELEIAPALGEADLFRTLQMLPGVTSQNDFSSALTVRGGSPDENLILLDGVEIYNPYHFGGIFSAFNTNAIESAELQSGGFPVAYGGRLSSVLTIRTREGQSKNHPPGNRWKYSDWFDISHASMDLSLLSMQSVVEGPLFNGGYAIAGRRTYFDQLSKLANHYNSTIPELPYYFYDLQWKVWSQVSPRHRLEFTGYSGADDLALDLGGNSHLSYAINFDWNWGNRANSIGLVSILSPNLVMKTRLSYSRYNVDADLLSTDTNPTPHKGKNNFLLTNQLRDHTVSSNLSWLRSQQHQLQVGLQFKQYGFDYRFSGNEMTLMSQQDNPALISVYLQEQWTPSPLMQFHLGIRPSHYSYSKDIRTDIRGGFRYHLRKHLVLKGAAGSYTQYLFTSNQSDGILRVVDFWNAVPEYLDPQHALHYILGLNYQTDPGYTFSAEAYYKPYTNLLMLNPLQHVSDPSDDFISGTGTAYGAEFLLKRTRGALTGWLAYTYARTIRRVDLDGNGTLERAADEIYPSKYDRRHTFHLMVNYRLTEQQNLGLTWTWTSGQPYTPVTGKRYGGTGTAGWYQSYSLSSDLQGPRNSATMPAYLRGDLRYENRFALGRFTGALQFQVINFTNHFNALLYQWDHSGEQSTVVATSMFPIIPTVGVSLEY